MLLNISKKMLSRVIILTGILLPLALMADSYQEKYRVNKDDTLSEILWRKGVKGKKALYGKSGNEGAVMENKHLNPQISNWRRIKPGDVIKLVIPDKRKVDSPIKSEIPFAPNDTVSGYYIGHRFNLGFGLTYVKEVQNVQILKTDAALIAPSIQYTFIYRNKANVNVPAWESKFFSELSYTFKPAEGTSLPINGKIEAGTSRYSMLKFGRNSVRPYLGLRYSFDSSVTQDINANVSSRRIHSILIGVRPEFTSYISSTRIEYAPFFYKSIYAKSLGEKLGGYELGLRTDIGVAFSNDLSTSLEYNYNSYGNETDTMNISWHRLLLGLGYRL